MDSQPDMQISNGDAQYKRGRALRVRLDGHPEPVQMVSIERSGKCAGGGLMLVVNRGDGEIDRVVQLLNDAERPRMGAEVGRLSTALEFSAIAIGLCVVVENIGKELGVSDASALAFIFPCVLVIAAVVVYGMRWLDEKV